MKYVKGTQTYSLDLDNKTAPTTKANIICNGEVEGIWIKQGDGMSAFMWRNYANCKNRN